MNRLSTLVGDRAWWKRSQYNEISDINTNTNPTDDKDKPLEDNVRGNFEVASTQKEEMLPILIEPPSDTSLSSPKSSSSKLATDEQESQPPAAPSSAENGPIKTPGILTLFCHYLRQNMAWIIIVILLLIIYALSGERASSRGQLNLLEDEISATAIEYRPCQIYTTGTDGILDDNGGLKVQVLQTSLGEPSVHWGQIPCLVYNSKEKHTSKRDGLSDWSWLFGDDDMSKGDDPVFEYGMPSAEINVDFKSGKVSHPEREPIMGFGGAFTEATALNFKTLNEEGQSAVMNLLFGREGLGYSIGRVHMNSCDFCVESYAFDTVDGDFDLEHFDMTVQHDADCGMIEMMVNADAIAKQEWSKDEGDHGMRIIVSPWSPPAWMKAPTWDDVPGAVHAASMDGSHLPNCLREGTGPESRYAKSWALYFSKFLTAYKSLGVNLFAVTVQNEPEFPAPWEACSYNASNEGTFISNHLGPQLRESHPEVKLFMFDHNKDHAPMWAKVILDKTNPASDYVDGTGLHWYAGGMQRLLDGAQGEPNMHRYVSMLKDMDVKPDHLILGTEACHCPSTGYAGGDLNVAWYRAERYAHTILADLAAGSNGWVEWNLVLDAVGGPNHLKNLCDSPLLAVPYRAKGSDNITEIPSFEHAGHPYGPVLGDSMSREELNARGFPSEYLDVGVVVQPMFYYMGHISRHVRPGSRAVSAIVNQNSSNNIDDTLAVPRTFRHVSKNGDIVAGGGINGLALPGMEVTTWPCEGSTRQKWTLTPDGYFQVPGHDWLGKKTFSCIGKKVDSSFDGLLLSECNHNAGLFKMKSLVLANTNEEEDGAPTINIVFLNSNQNEGENCLVVRTLKNNGGSYGPRGGAQVSIGNCDISSAAWKFDERTGEVTSDYFVDKGGEVCLTTGWPFLQVGAFDTPNGKKKKTTIILNEAGEDANYVLRDGGEVLMTNSIPAHSIQTVLYD